MIQVSPSKYGRPGDMMYATPPAPIVVSELGRPSTAPNGQTFYSVGLHLADEDMRATAQAMREAFATAFPGATGKLKYPIRQTRSGVWLLFAETPKAPVILDATGKPASPPPIGSSVRLLARLCPFRRIETGRQGVGLFMNRIQLLPPDPAAPNPP